MEAESLIGKLIKKPGERLWPRSSGSDGGGMKGPGRKK